VLSDVGAEQRCEVASRDNVAALGSAHPWTHYTRKGSQPRLRPCPFSVTGEGNPREGRRDQAPNSTSDLTRNESGMNNNSNSNHHQKERIQIHLLLQTIITITILLHQEIIVIVIIQLLIVCLLLISLQLHRRLLVIITIIIKIIAIVVFLDQI